MMPPDSVQAYEQLVQKANEYHKKALWQEKLRSLQEALAICESPGFPEATLRKQRLFYDLAGIWRRLGQYDKAEKLLRESLDVYPNAPPTFRASVLGELGVVARHNERFLEAREAFREQGRLAREAPSSMEADAEICRAIGNEGMCAYNLSQQQEPKDMALLATAFTQLRERITRAQALQQRLLKEAPQSRYLSMAQSWEIIGMDRLTLCHIAAGEISDAVHVAEESQRRQTREDPTVTAFSKFFYGNALWHNGQRKEALEEWNAPFGTCSSPMAFCKEPGKEHHEYLQLMASAGVNFDSYDEQGFSALDHAVLSDSPDARKAIIIVENAVRKALSRDIERDHPDMLQEDAQRRVDEEIKIRKHQAELRRQYRTILQEHIRPALRSKSDEVFKNLRMIYAKFLSENTMERRAFSNFHYVKYVDFLDHGKIPISSSGLAKQFVRGSGEAEDADEDDYIIFISYRWVGGNTPDDANGTQWHRIKRAVQDFLDKNSHIQLDRLGLWLDYVCIDQENEQEKMRGVDALPLAVTQCNALISLVDEAYYNRAWCAVEVMLICALRDSYGLHQWWEHSNDTLKVAKTERVFDVDSLRLTKERLDRPKVDFLMRQSKLLGRDDA